MRAREQESDQNAERWSRRWSELSHGLGLSPTEPVALALSGGADSVFLLHVLAKAQPRPRILAIHVDHGLRGEESADDAAFCARLCAKLGVPFARRGIELDPDGSNLEARAREARYRALADEAREAGLRYLVTGHHGDDALETLLMRWMRGSDLPGLAGLKARNVLGSSRGTSTRETPVQVVRPLLTMRREEVRQQLRQAGLKWREDSSNADPRFTRNRVRGALLPEIERACGPDGVESLRAFAGAVERLEEELAGRTAHLAWATPEHAPAVRSADEPYPGGTLDRAELVALAGPLQRRALWRLLSEGTGQPPSRCLLAEIEQDLAEGLSARRALSGGWTLHLRRDNLLLTPPGPGSGRLGDPELGDRELEGRALAPTDRGRGVPATERTGHGRAGAYSRSPSPQGAATQESAPDGAPPRPSSEAAAALEPPCQWCLPDGRVLEATWVDAEPGDPVPKDRTWVELDACGLTGPLAVRSMRPGDRFHPLGAPGSRALGRFLRDVGVPAAERGRVPLVFHGDQLLWVAGLRPDEAHRVRPGTGRRLRLRLLNAAPVQ